MRLELWTFYEEIHVFWLTYEFAWKALEGLLVEGEGFEPSNS